MGLRRRTTIHWAVLGAVGFLAACIEITNPAPPDIEFDTNGGSCYTGACSCPVESMANRAYRFTKLSVDEPEAMASDLDSQWENELANYLLNVIFVVKNATLEPGAETAFSSLSLTAGSGWRYPGQPYFAGDPSEPDYFTPDYYCLIDENLNVDVDVNPDGTAQCKFKNVMPTNLAFHLGSKIDPLMCAPLLTPADSTPIKDLTFSFGFNENCTSIVDGYMEGCLPQDEVNKICLCLQAGTCTRNNPNPGAVFPNAPTDPNEPFPSGVLGGYCSEACGANGGWSSFRALIDAKKDTDGNSLVLPNCTISGTNTPGYRLTARFEAVEITAEFTPNISDECTVR
jgi:hypothetical protein